MSRLLGRTIRTIVQFGPPRSGSTLVYNLLRELFPRKNIRKTHRLDPRDAQIPVVLTYRHPLDSIASSLQRYDLPATDENIAKQVQELSEFGLWRVLEVKDRRNVLALRYEDFYQDFDVIFNAFESFFEIVINPETRKSLGERFEVSVIARMVEPMGSFENFDPETHWHGKHISRQMGRSGSFREIFTSAQVTYLEEVYDAYLRKLDYR